MKIAKTFACTLLFTFFLTFSGSLASAQVRVSGLLLEKGTRKPLEAVNVFLLPQKLKATTDSDGRFIFTDVPREKIQWIVNFSGYKKIEFDEDLAEQEADITRTLYLERETYLVYETTVYGKGEKRDSTTKTLKREQFLSAPGSNGDPVKAVQNFAGVNRPAPFQAQVIIQGSGPEDTSYTIDGHEVPLIFHFGGLTSVVVPDAVDSVDFLSAGYGPEFGRASGGLVGIRTKDPKTDRLHGLAFFDVFNAGALLEGPIGEKSSFLLSVRKAYIGEALRFAFKDNEDFNLTVAPSYSDFTGIYKTELSDKGTFKISAIASNDTLEFVLKQPIKQDPSIRGEFENKTSFFRLIPEYIHKHSENTISRYSLGLGRDWIKFIVGDSYFKLATYQVTARAELEKKLTNEWTSYWGFDNRYATANVKISIPNYYTAGGVPNPISTGTRRTIDIDGESTLLGAYWRNSIHWADSRWTYLPNIRFDYFDRTKEFLPGPRPAIRYAIDESLTLRAAGGLYYQPPSEEQLDETFGNPSIKSSYAIHSTVGAEKDFRQGSSDGWIASLDVFYKWLRDLAVQSTNLVNQNDVLKPENYNNSGSGRVYGAQSQIRYEMKPFSLGVNYTLSRSTRQELGKPEYPFQYDQTHLLGVLGAYETGNWRFSSRFRYSTGNPYTPITGSTYDADADVFIPRRGSYFSKRLEPFYQLDVRIDKKWVFNTWILSAYLDIQNITNRKNPEQTVYSYDYTQSQAISGLPILPTLGLKGEF